MSTAEILSTISTISYVISALCLVLSVFFWFKYKIPSVYGDLSGRTARKSIAQMRENNEKSGNKFYKPSSTNKERGKVTEAIEKIQKETNKNEQQDSSETTPLDDTSPLDDLATTKLSSDETTELQTLETEQLNAEETTELSVNEETAILGNDNETEMLSPSEMRSTINSNQCQLTIIEEVMIINTNERVL